MIPLSRTADLLGTRRTTQYCPGIPKGLTRRPVWMGDTGKSETRGLRHLFTSAHLMNDLAPQGERWGLSFCKENAEPTWIIGEWMQRAGQRASNSKGSHRRSSIIVFILF